MRMFLISDNLDTQTGIRLAGIDGVIVHEKDEVKKVLDNVLEDKTIGIILISEKLAAMIPEYIKRIKLEVNTHLIVEIPDRHGTLRPKDSITAYVRDDIGLRL